MTTSSGAVLLAAVVAGLGILGCAPTDRQIAATSTAAVASARLVHRSSAEAAANVFVAQPAPNSCGWISRDEVEAVIGPLAHPPATAERGCRYTIAKPVAFAVDLSVNLDGDLSGEQTPGLSKSDGWDARRSHGGRIGHVRISVNAASRGHEPAPDTMDSLAARVRDRIPDLPFAISSRAASTVETRNPCSLVTEEEAEIVLGKLVVRPYRSARKGPLAYPGGESCAYYTLGHHVLVITPHYSGGKLELAALTAKAGTPRSQSGWNDAAMRLDGNLALLKGDRLLEISYVMSSTDEAGALRLARSAMDRLNSHQ